MTSLDFLLLHHCPGDKDMGFVPSPAPQLGEQRKRAAFCSWVDWVLAPTLHLKEEDFQILQLHLETQVFSFTHMLLLFVQQSPKGYPLEVSI